MKWHENNVGVSDLSIILYKFIISINTNLPQTFRVKGNNETIVADTELTLIIPIGCGYSETLNINTRIYV